MEDLPWIILQQELQPIRTRADLEFIRLSGVLSPNVLLINEDTLFTPLLEDLLGDSPATITLIIRNNYLTIFH